MNGLCQLPAIRRSEFYSALLDLQAREALTPMSVMDAFNEHIEGHAVRLGVFCNEPGCNLLLTDHSEPFSHNSVDIFTACPEHGRRPPFSVLRLAVAFVPDGPR